jgi:hypothetical protein
VEHNWCVCNRREIHFGFASAFSYPRPHMPQRALLGKHRLQKFPPHSKGKMTEEMAISVDKNITN